ncbi:hypothetical protein F5883DRAFT_643244 [Diaporthe sp. PMI_573]|nr:hypothetical protein F5883DRAFT_643244 [Diaporthaceae sp. PMI_573]
MSLVPESSQGASTTSSEKTVVLVTAVHEIQSTYGASLKSRPFTAIQIDITLRNDPEHRFYGIDGEACRTSKAALNMGASCQRFRNAADGIKVVAFNPGWCLSNLTGEQGREWRIKGGARDPNRLLHVDCGILPW